MSSPATFAPVKVIVWFFSFWLLVLTGLPCPDAECHAHASQTTRSATSHSADEDPDHKTPCSPFCHCTTCPGFALPRLLAYDLPAQPSTGITTLQVFHYQSTTCFAVAFSIWQPPRI